MTAPTIDRPNFTAAPAGPRYIEAARELIPLLKAEARAIEEARELTPVVLEALVARNLLQPLLSPARGEGDFTISDAMHVLQTLALGDASTAWDVMAAMGGCIITGFLPAGAVEAMFASPSDAAATAVGRMGKAVAVEGGYLVEARWPFLSGSPHASWIGGLCMVFDGDQPRMSPEGEPHVIIPLLRKERVTLLGNWHTTGLRGTGSQDAVVNGAFVPDSEVADFARGVRPDLPLLYSINEDAAAPIVAAAVALGIAGSALESFREIQRSRTHQSGIPAVNAPLAQLTLAEATTKVDQARAALFAVGAGIDNELAEGRLPEDSWVPRASLAATQAAETAVEVVSRLYRAAGSSAVFTGSPLERALRDVFTIGAHRMLQRENYLVHGRSLFE